MGEDGSFQYQLAYAAVEYFTAFRSHADLLFAQARFVDSLPKHYAYVSSNQNHDTDIDAWSGIVVYETI